MQVSTRALAIAAAAGVVIVGGSAAVASNTGPNTPGPTAGVGQPAAGVSAQQAVHAAQQKVPGASVTKVERDDDGNAWEVDLQRRGVEYKVTVDPATGAVQGVEQDAAEADDSGQQADDQQGDGGQGDD